MPSPAGLCKNSLVKSVHRVRKIFVDSLLRSRDTGTACFAWGLSFVGLVSSTIQCQAALCIHAGVLLDFSASCIAVQLVESMYGPLLDLACAPFFFLPGVED